MKTKVGKLNLVNSDFKQSFVKCLHFPTNSDLSNLKVCCYLQCSLKSLLVAEGANFTRSILVTTMNSLLFYYFSPINVAIFDFVNKSSTFFFTILNDCVCS